MKQNERAGIMRIVSDIVKADSIIDLREIDYLDGIKDKYRITKEDEAMGDFHDFVRCCLPVKEFISKPNP